MKIEPLAPTSVLLEDLADEARQQGYAFMDRLLEEARSGTNRFDDPGECFCGVSVNNQLVACGGINRDPYVRDQVGRLRHLYVLQSYRRNGIAVALVQNLLERSKPTFKLIRLRTPNEQAGRFYDALGFQRTTHETATHVIEI